MAVVINGKSKQNHILISDTDMERLLSLSGEAVKLYLHLLKFGADLPCAAVCRSIGVSEARLPALERELCEAGLTSPAPDTPAKPAALAPEPEYSAGEIADFKLRDKGFAAVAAEAERVMSKMLTISDLRMIMKLYHYFGLSAECMFLLLGYTAERCADIGRRMTIASLRRESERWISMGIDSPERADAYIKSEKKILSLAADIKKTIGKSTYTADERARLRRWAEYGCDPEVVKIAMDISKKRIFEIKLSYMDKIIESWKARGLNTAREIEKYEERQKTAFDRRAAAAARKNGGKTPKKRGTGLTAAELESLKQTEEFYKNGGGE